MLISSSILRPVPFLRMATVPESLLDDLDELDSDDEGTRDLDDAGDDQRGAAAPALGGVKRRRVEGGNDNAGDAELDDLSDEDEEVADATVTMELPADAELDAQLSKLRGRAGFRSVAHLRETARFRDHMERIAASMARTASTVSIGAGHLEEQPDYKLVVASNQIIAALDDEHAALHKYVADAFSPKFPELPNLVPSAPEFMRVVQAVQNETDLTLVDLGGILPSAQVMSVTVTASTTAGKPLPAATLADVLGACDEYFALEDAKGTLLTFIESRMAAVAPNVSALLGTRVAALLVGIAGGVTALSRIPSCNVQVIGQKKRALSGFSRIAVIPHAGVIFDAEIVQGAPLPLRRKTARVLAAKAVLAARVDSGRGATDGAVGRAYHAEVSSKLAKWMEPAPGKQKRPLPVPDDKPSKKRGGRRYRKLKEKMAMTDSRREAGRMSFADTAGVEYSDMVMGRDSGRLGIAGSGSVRIERKDQSKLVKRQHKALQYQQHHSSGLGGTGGASSSLAFASHTGIELLNPAAAAERAQKAVARDGYFSSTGTFSQIRKGT